MNNKLFQTLIPSITGNSKLRVPQEEGFLAAKAHFHREDPDREVGFVLPVGCGKSGLIALVPFAVAASRVLVVAPGVRIAAQLFDDFNPSNEEGHFYTKCRILQTPPYPEPAQIRGRSTNRSDLNVADVVVTNIDQIQGESNRWIQDLPEDFFDLILFDEGHHNVAASWTTLREKFPKAKIANFSATPTRADGQIMAGKIIYSYPIFKAIDRGYVKRMKAVVLNPRTLRYVQTEGGQEVEVSLEELRRLAAENAQFRRKIVSSEESLSTIVDASIRELYRLRIETGEQRLKIIASALNYDHCAQIVAAYRSKHLRADFIHSKEGPANQKVLSKLDNHELDVIVQVRMLGEGFDHPYLSVAAVFSIFANLSPFVQFAGRIMRVLDNSNPDSLRNQGVVVFHAGSNVARIWADFQNFSQADQEFFDQLLLPLEDITFDNRDELNIEPRSGGERSPNTITITGQDCVVLEEIPLLEEPEVKAAIDLLVERGLSVEEFRKATELRPVPTTRQAKRRADQSALDQRVKNAAAKSLRERGMSPEGRNLDRNRLKHSNFIFVKSAIDKTIASFVQRNTGDRHEYTQEELDRIRNNFDIILERALQEAFRGS